MSRLRVRIELNRGGVGVPLEKLASVVQQAQSFFRMLGNDVQIDQSAGEWLGFDFDHESLNFTAEFVGPVTQEQVTAFHSAFDGTTPLRRATIAQFARIADAIEEDEVIGFGLYLNQGEDPAEWRCLSRRDALRITEEIRVLLGAGETGPESHLPSAAEVNTGARYLFGRRDRGVDAARLTGAVREVEASLSKRISRLEGEVADHSGYIQDLRSKSVDAEQSMGRLLSAVEGFCEQAANRLETVTTPVLAAAATAGAAAAPRIAPPAAEIPELAQAASPGSYKPASSKNVVPEPVEPPTDETAESLLVQPAPRDWWRSPMVISAGLGTVVILLGILLWPSGSNQSNPVTSGSERVSSAPVTAPAVSSPAPAPPVNEKPAAAPRPVPAAPTPPVASATRIELIASEPSWVSIRGADGTTQMSGLIEPGSSRTVDIREPAVLRAGNAGGLTIQAHGKSLGPLGAHGAVREVEFKGGDFKPVPIQ